MSGPRAYVRIVGPAGRRSAVICDPCQHRQEHARTEPAKTAAREHNQARHAFPADRRSRDTLDSTDHEEHS
jgi:hypothetical protein